jgi:linearmycin/streptolysin S transport system permease protein
MRTLLVAGTELRRRVRSRSALVTAFGGPLALALVFGLLVSGSSSASFRIGVADADASALARGIAASLTGRAPTRAVRFVALRASAARPAVDRGDVDAAVLVPRGFAASAEAGRPGPLTVLRDPDRRIAGDVAAAVASGVAGQVRQATLAVATTAAAQGAAPDAATVAAAQRLEVPLALAPVALGGHEIDGAAYYGASMSIIFLFFTIAYAPRALLAERRDGTLARVLASPTRPVEVLAGKTLAVTVLALCGLVTVWLATTLAFGARWGSPPAVLGVIVATVLAVAGVSILVSSLASSEQQVDALTSIVTFTLALVGGNFVGPGVLPGVLGTVRGLTPNGIALDAFTDLSADAAGLGEVARAVAVLVAIGVVTGGAGLLRVYRVAQA